MSEEILKLWRQGFNPNQIAARLMIHKHIVEEVITSGGPIPTPVEQPIPKPQPKKKAAAARRRKIE
jgi:hypothetical protein